MQYKKEVKCLVFILRTKKQKTIKVILLMTRKNSRGSILKSTRSGIPEIG